MKYQFKKFAAAIALTVPVSLTKIALARGIENQIPVTQKDQQYEFVCKFAKTATTPSSKNSNSAENRRNPKTLQIQGKDLVVTPIFDSTEAPAASSVSSDNKINKADLSGLNQFYRMSSSRASNDELHQMARELEATNQVEYCEFIPKYTPPPADIAPLSTDYSAYQGHIEPDPGIDVAYARSLGLTGSNVTIADIERDWNLDHEDLVDQNVRFGTARSPDDAAHHGTGVIGILVAGDNGYGMTGTVPDAEMIVFSEEVGRLQALSDAITALSPGDIIILEMQRGGPQTPGSIKEVKYPGESFVPADYDRSIWDTVKIATDAGIHVVATAGNGNVNLDHSLYDDYRARGDNGSIMVGAGSSTALHNKLTFSTYGSPLHLQGWGENVWTLGTGNLAKFGNDDNQAYTYSFNGTSSAAPIVASAVALVQDYAETFLGRDISPLEMRTLLIETGIAQGEGGLIGPLPNIRAAIERLSEEISSGNICDGINEYPNWTARDWPGGPYNHANALDKMVYQGGLYEANWYTSSVPGSDPSWLSLGACATSPTAN
ncbi:cellulose-binding domain-containing protein [Teredinibacter turnerae]|uniref:cellulose-binding domain-containing protein n=1 Tax=Teredinibacter turnerae TaxID=2426 RepID=UPI00037D52C9